VRLLRSRRDLRLVALGLGLVGLCGVCSHTTPVSILPQAALAIPGPIPKAATAAVTPLAALGTPTEFAPEIAPTPSEAPVASTTATSAGLLRVHFIDVGQGDAELIVSPEGKLALIDGGEAGSGVLPYLRSLGVSKLDLVVATHPHADHIGGLVQVLKAFPVTEVVTNGQPTTTLTYEHFLDAIAGAKAEYVEVRRGDTIPFGGLTFQVLSPQSVTGPDLNNNSIVLRLVYGASSFLFTGDADQAAEASILSMGLPVQADILKVGHHGSRTASSPIFLRAVKPEIAVYSAGIGNTYGHPHPETLAALVAAGAQVYGTDVNGTVVVTADNAGGYKVEVAKQSSPRAPPILGENGMGTPAGAGSGSPMKLQIVSVTSPVTRGGRAALTAHTVPGADCTIKVYYKSGASKAAGLSPQSADAKGDVTWSWTVGRSTTPGNWRIVVTATEGGETMTEETYFTVAK
jgi:competence protein ComEC